MPRFYFDVTDGVQVVDPTGEILCDLDQARVIAMQILTEIAPSHVIDIWRGQTLRVVICDGSHQPLGELRMSAIGAVTDRKD